MNDQTSTTRNTHSQPVLCKNSCGFFGSNATGNMCSKCFNRIQKANKKEGGGSVTIATQAPKPMEIDTPQPTPSPVTGSTDTVALSGDTVKFSDSVSSPGNKEVAMLAPSASLKKKKKKKQSYKSMMASMTQNTKSAADIQKEKENLRKVTGGGAFLKIDKI